MQAYFQTLPYQPLPELQESIEVDYPYDTVRAIFDITEITDIGVKLINFFDDDEDNAEEKLKN